MGELLAVKVATSLTDETELSGDLKVCWDKDNPEEVYRAQKNFEKYLSKGWIAYSEEPEGRRRILVFNSDLDKIVLIPPLGGG
ncbi:MAG: hypothetical protein JSW01_01605 [Candidatus Bathyarchaeota archaeon]|nr:MAG: hypothetical protein JSW01_01605 [Candidatus Bathyarchaeota archaeon]